MWFSVRKAICHRGAVLVYVSGEGKAALFLWYYSIE